MAHPFGDYIARQIEVSDDKTLFCPLRALDQERHKVLEIDSKGNLYLYRSALLCKNEIIKRLTEDNFKLIEPSTIGKVQSFISYTQNSGVTSLAPLSNSPLSTLTTLIYRPQGKKINAHWFMNDLF